MTQKRILSFICAVWPHKEAILLIRSTAFLLLVIATHHAVAAFHPTGWDVLMIDTFEKIRNICLALFFIINEIRTYSS